MSWLANSLMAKNGVAKGKEGDRHNLTIEDQGTFHYVYGPYVKPALKVSPGAVTFPVCKFGPVQVLHRSALKGRRAASSAAPRSRLSELMG